MRDSFQLIEIFHVQSTDLKMAPSRASEAQRPKGRGFPVRYFPYGCIVPLPACRQAGIPPSRVGFTGHLPAG